MDARVLSYNNLLQAVQGVKDALDELIQFSSYSESQKTVEHSPESLPEVIKDPEVPFDNLSLFQEVVQEFNLPDGHKAKLLIWLSYKTERGETYSRFGMQGLILRSLQVFPNLEDFTDAMQYTIRRGGSDFLKNQN